MSRADLDKQPFDVAGMFDAIARRYDLMNDVAALGRVRRWRKDTVAALDLPAGSTVLDIAAGTGTSTAALRESGLRALAADFSLGMLREGRRRQPEIPFVAADATALPIGDDAFDGATISYGLRNVHEPRKALEEMTRVVRPGGVVVVAEFSTPTSALFRTVYERYLVRAIPMAARTVTRRASDAYDYLAESILNWPDQETLRDWFLEAGLVHVQYRNLNGGIVALHRGYVPDEKAC